ncbi:hypothetical protein BDV98DRAFT_655758 [Pterulicium gracile]|uniref:C2H2-type domain-containing protein n=1 Tax=Pterulicium gracile TaxID=1884261 RepID=A0A5C3QJ77_9AGAR|nr:hypothetical protein BDV98DRAFT_655758 [Pterula gracilis]
MDSMPNDTSSNGDGVVPVYDHNEPTYTLFGGQYRCTGGFLKQKPCSESFGRKCDYERHKRRHAINEDDLKLPCVEWQTDFPDCPFKTHQMTGLRRHIRTHYGNKNQMCSHCPLGFVDQSALLRHRKEMHDYVPNNKKINTSSGPISKPQPSSNARNNVSPELRKSTTAKKHAKASRSESLARNRSSNTTVSFEGSGDLSSYNSIMFTLSPGPSFSYPRVSSPFSSGSSSQWSAISGDDANPITRRTQFDLDDFGLSSSSSSSSYTPSPVLSASLTRAFSVFSSGSFSQLSVDSDDDSDDFSITNRRRGRRGVMNVDEMCNAPGPPGYYCGASGYRSSNDHLPHPDTHYAPHPYCYDPSRPHHYRD